MYYKKCNTCANKTCLQTKVICKSMDAWLKKYVEVPQAHKIMNSQELEKYRNLTEGV